MRNRNSFIAAIFISLLTLSACGTGSGTANQSVGSGSDVSMVDPAIKDAGMSSEPVTQAVIRTGDMTIESSDVEQVFADVKDAVTKIGGRVESSNFQGRIDGYGPNAFLTIRIAESKLDAAVEEISKLGKRTSLSISTSDVTLQTVDLQAKIDALEESRVRLQKLLDSSTSTADLIAGEQAMATLRTELDGYKSQLDYLSNQVAESTLNVQIVDDNTSVTSGLRSVKEIFLQAVRGFLNAFQSAFVFIITAIPWLLMIGIAVLIGRAISKLISRLVRRRNQR